MSTSMGSRAGGSDYRVNRDAEFYRDASKRGSLAWRELHRPRRMGSPNA